MATQKKSPLLSRFTWFLGFLGWIPAHSSAASTEAYPPIDSSIISSANYEIRRLLCPDCGSVSDVVYLPERESFFVSTFQGDLWKINQHGQAVDVLRGKGTLPDSGIYFGEDNYIDWFFTGDPSPKPYLEVLDADHLSDAEFAAELEAADARSMDYGAFSRGHYYLREGDQWRRLDRQYSEAPERRSMLPSKEVIVSYHRSTDNNDKALPFLRLTRFPPNVDASWRDPTKPIYIKRYKRRGWSFGRLLDFLGDSWRGTYGRGHFHLQHQGEQLTFSAMNLRSNHSARGDDPDINFYYLPPDHAAGNIAFLSLYGERKNYVKTELGLYVIKPKATFDKQTPSNLQQRHVWQPVFTGFNENPGNLRQIIYINGESESPETDVNQTLNPESRPAPLMWDFHHQMPELSKPGHNYIKLNEHFYFLRDLSYSSSDHFFAKLYFDREETQAALAQLQQREDLTGPISFSITAEWPPKGMIYHLAVQRGSESIALNKAYFQDERVYERDKTPSGYVLHRLQPLFEKAMQNQAEDAAFIRDTGRMVEHIDENDEVAEAIAQATVRLMFARLKNDNAEATEALFYHYIDALLPRTGFHSKALDIASAALVLDIKHQRPKVAEAAFRHLLDNGNLDIQTLRHDVLIYNLACYYAVQQQKTNMLEATARAIQLGKKPEQFMADTDFENYWDDSEFLAVIYQRE